MKRVKIVRLSAPPLGVRWDVVRIPLGRLVVGLTSTNQICRAGFVGKQTPTEIVAAWKRAWPGTRFARKPAGDPRRKSIAVLGSSFQVEVWKAVAAIPAGKVASYGEIASRLGRPRAFRAVGTACAQNLVAYFIPCFRMIRADGSGGFEGQQDLLRAEDKALRRGHPAVAK